MNRIEAFAQDRHLSPTPIAHANGHRFASNEFDLANLWEAYRVSRDESLRNRLLLHYLPLSKIIARHMQNRMPATVELDDLAQAAVLGMRSPSLLLIPPAASPSKTYCGLARSRAAVLDFLRSLDWAPRMLRSRVSRVQEMIRQLGMSTGTVPTDDQVSQALGMPLEELQSIRGDMVPPPSASAPAVMATPNIPSTST